METKLCPHCNKEISKRDYFCPFCGNAASASSRTRKRGTSVRKSAQSEEIDLSNYSDYVRIIFNKRVDKWELNLLEGGKHVLRKHYFDRREAEREAVHYIKEMGIKSGGSSSSEMEQSTRSRYDGIFYSDARRLWGVKVRGYRGSRILGYYRSEQEAIEAKEGYLREKQDKHVAMQKEKNLKTDALITFSERAGLWVVRIPRRRGGYKLLDYYDSEEEAVEAKDAYFKELESDNGE